MVSSTGATVIIMASAGAQLIEEHTVSLKTVCSVGAIVATGIWWLSRQFQKIEDRDQAAKEQIEKLERTITHLPCQGQSKQPNCTD